MTAKVLDKAFVSSIVMDASILVNDAGADQSRTTVSCPSSVRGKVYIVEEILCNVPWNVKSGPVFEENKGEIKLTF